MELELCGDRQSMELGTCVTDITSLEVYLAGRNYESRWSMDLGPCVTNISC